jgi:hypothetical protein
MKVRLSAEPTELERPGSVEIRWTVTGATAVLLSVAGKVDAADALSLTVDETTTIVLTAFDAKLGRVAARQVTVTVGERVPRGVIVPWWGDGSAPPEGWAICDGSDGTPDLRGRFIRGADGAGVVPHTFGDGGSHRHGLPPVSVDVPIEPGGAHAHAGWVTREYARDKRGPRSVAAATGWHDGEHSHRLTAEVPALRVEEAADPLPPWHALHYLMKR